ncbi:hypothetical protein Rhe02_19990 [Rhizocola hellebori]|uniref:Uncharacterized protein n=1 Tax=Rhizocola hellebori TaxID=1392758 RepID=A0A8J3Q5S6_9ACTN|nr:DUF6348 family protein [Rhizocola hellebori]GIH03932.1 hypothetical protein Rhe02_19990 [Rhizocola hellebori]
MSLELIAEHMCRFAGPWEVDADEVRGPGVAIRHGSACGSDGPGHLDIDFVLDNGVVISDCAMATGLHAWADTTAMSVMEYVRHGLGGQHDEFTLAFPGWRSVTGGVVGWGGGDDYAAVQMWAMHRPLLGWLAPLIKPELDRRSFNGIKLFLGGREGHEEAEVRVNGKVNERASQALFEMDWPRTAMGSVARAFVLLVSPEWAVSRTWRHRLKVNAEGDHAPSWDRAH